MTDRLDKKMLIINSKNFEKNVWASENDIAFNVLRTKRKRAVNIKGEVFV